MRWRKPLRRIRRFPVGFPEPCIPTRALKAPTGDGWTHEIKHDGYRLMVRKDAAGVRILTKNGFDWTKRFGWIVEAASKLKTASFTIDGEGVVAGRDGIADFSRLHSQGCDHEVFLYGFDLLDLNGEDLRLAPLIERKAKLAKVLAKSKGGIVLSEHLDIDPVVMFKHVCLIWLEGIVSKRAARRYVSGPTKDWLKIKNPQAPAMLRFQEAGEG